MSESAPCKKNRSPRILLVSSKQYLLPDLVWGCNAAGFANHTLLLTDIRDEQDLLIRLRQSVHNFQPDFCLTLNNLGFDRGGVVLNFFRKVRLPALSWFVDNPWLFLPDYQGLDSPFLVFAVWDKNQLTALRQAGYTAFYLPLAGNIGRMQDLAVDRIRQAGFVGNSMHSAIKRTERFLPSQLCQELEPVVQAFVRSPQQDVGRFLQKHFPHFFVLRQQLGVRANSLDALLYWVSTQAYRIACVEQLFPFAPTIAGDAAWKEVLAREGEWFYHPPLGYYADLFSFYNQTALNLNTSSMQMKGAINQRVFDVPLAGSFLLTDQREQLAELFEPGLEIICYNEPEEIGELARFYLDRPGSRQAVCLKARQRIMKEHGYQHRLRFAVAAMQEIFCG